MEGNKTLIITGMHRSGTSLFANYLQKCGLFIGRYLLKTERWGHSENMEIMKAQQRLLERNNLHVFDMNHQISFDDIAKKEIDPLIKLHDSYPAWGFKDPRSALFLDDWKRILHHPIYLFIFRHPALVVNSMMKITNPDYTAAQEKGPEYLEKIWMFYNQKILDFYQKNKEICFILNVNQLVDNHEKLIENINRRFDLSLKPKSMSDTFNKSLLTESSQINSSDEAISLYEKLEDLCV